MIKICLTVLISAVLFFAIDFGCTKSSPGYYNCTGTKPSADSPALLLFAKNNGITVSKDSSGLYYQIVNLGSGAYPSSASKIYISYTGQLMDGSIFDSTTNSSSTGFVLNQLIQGWQIGIPKIQSGGHIKLLIPSSLAYGCMGAGTKIPPNSPLYFDISLVSIQ